MYINNGITYRQVKVMKKEKHSESDVVNHLGHVGEF